MTTAVQVQYRRGTAAQVASFTGAQGELIVDTTNNRVVVQDGATAGGWPTAMLGVAQTFSAIQTFADGIVVESGNGSNLQPALLSCRQTVSAEPVPLLRPVATNSVLAFDLMPNGSPSVSSEGNITWLDVCNADIYASGSTVGAARISINGTNNAAQFGSVAYGGATLPIVQIIYGIGNVVGQYGTHGWWLDSNLGIGTETSPQAPVVISSNVTTGHSPLSGTMLGIVSADAQANVVDIDTYGSSSAIIARTAGGTAASPSNLTANSAIGQLAFLPYYNGSFGVHAAVIEAIYTDSGTTAGTQLIFKGTAAGSSSSAIALIVQSGVIIGSSGTDPGAGNLAVGGDIYTGDTNFMHRCSASLANGAASSAGTLTNAPSAGNPTKWIAIDDNGTTRHIPAW